MTPAGTQAGRRTKVRRTKIGRVELSRHCGDGGRRRYTAAPRNAAAMAGSVAARSIVIGLAGNALQLAAFFRRCCSNVLDVATLLRWPATRWTSQRYCDGRQRAGPRNVVAMSDSTTTPANAALQRFCFCFFFTRQLEERKRMGEREKF
jgi:hypothetical protein